MNLKKRKFSSKPKSTEQNSTNLIKAFAISKEGDIAITGNELGQVNLWNLLEGELVDTIIDVPSLSNSQEPAIKSGVCKLVLSNSNVFSVIASNNHMVYVYDIEMGDVVTEFTEHQSPVKHIHIIDEKILTSDGFTQCKIWLAHSGQLLESITVDCQILGLSPDSKYVVSGPGENM